MSAVLSSGLAFVLAFAPAPRVASAAGGSAPRVASAASGSAPRVASAASASAPRVASAASGSAPRVASAAGGSALRVASAALALRVAPAAFAPAPRAPSAACALAPPVPPAAPAPAPPNSAAADSSDLAPPTAEPPAEAGSGDWTVARADSVERGWVETTFSTLGGSGNPRTAERVRFRGPEAEGDWRAGDAALGGGWLATPVGGAQLRAGRLAPRWGRGLVLGSPGQPWTLEADDRGAGAALRGHAGDGAALSTRGGRFELLAGRFAGRSLAGARARAGPLALGVVAAPGARPDAQASLAGRIEDLEGELAIDPAGRWRAEVAARRRVSGGAVTLRARGGLPGLRTLAEPARSGPARALAAGLERAVGPWRLTALGALWAFAPGAPGALAALAASRPLGQHAAVAFGFDEQHGPRREGVAATSGPLRQGAWGAWRARVNGRSLELRHELRGSGAFARPAVRRVLTARAESALPGGVVVALTHSVWATRSADPLWLVESEPDRLTLRAVPVTGRRTRVELAARLPAGRARGTYEWTASPGRKPAPQWRLEWTQRTRP